MVTSAALFRAMMNQQQIRAMESAALLGARDPVELMMAKLYGNPVGGDLFNSSIIPQLSMAAMGGLKSMGKTSTGSSAKGKLKEALKDYDEDAGKKLSAACKKATEGETPHGECPKGPSEAISQVLGINFSANGGDWDKLAKEHPDKFKLVEVTADELKDLPPGCIVNYNVGDGKIGHVTMTDGKGGSDCDGHEDEVPKDPNAKITVLIPIKKKN